MMRHLLCGLSLLTGLIPALAAGKVQALWQSLEQFGINDISLDAETQQLCLAGRLFDDTVPGDLGRIQLFDLQSGKSLWNKTVKPPKDYDSLRFDACLRHGNALYLLAAVESRTASAGSVYEAWVYQFDLQGRQLAAKPIAVKSRRSEGWNLLHEGGQLYAMGMGEDGEIGQRTFSNFIARIDANLKIEVVESRKGGFQTHMRPRLIGHHFFVGGRFYPQKESENDKPDYAHSKIGLNGNYVWSTRPLAALGDEFSTSVLEDGSMQAASNRAQQTFFAQTDPTGRVQLNLEYKSRLCRVHDMVRQGASVVLLRTPCGNGLAYERKGAQLLRLDTEAISETPVTSVPGTPQLLRQFGRQWFVLTLDGKNSWQLVSGDGRID